MSKKGFPKFVYVLILVVLAVGIYFLVTALSTKTPASLSVSGTIESVSSVISPEIGGKVTEIDVNEGDTVKTSAPLFVIDDTLLQAQRAVASANLSLAQSADSTAGAAVDTAQNNYVLAVSSALQESAGIRAVDWMTQNPEGYTLPGGSFTPADLIAAAQKEVDAAFSARQDAQKVLDSQTTDTANTDFVQAEKDLLEKKFAAQSASDVLTKASTADNSDLKDAAQVEYDDALASLKDAQSKYDDLAKTDSAKSLLSARNDLVLATERDQTAQTRLFSLQTGMNSLKVHVAYDALQQAKAAATQAGQSVAQAQASLALLDAEIAKLKVTAPMDGVVLTRSIELGEVLSPGSPAVTLGQLDPLTITVYVPEAQVGQLSIGQSADLAVDSFPGQNFTAKITHIADQAEFTPRNVQTAESRKTTVFAVKLQMANPDGKLKPGMPADVTFLQ
jgi:multidrug efflux pump subunit AcrA (membrane-fusion protein)